MSDKLNETFQKHLKLLHEHLNINEWDDPEIENYYNLLKAGKIPEKQATFVKDLVRDGEYRVDGYKDQIVTLYAPPNHGEKQHQPQFGNIVYIDEEGEIITGDEMRKKNLKKYPEPKKLSIHELN